MAKKKKDKQYTFTPPDFDRKEFILNEMKQIKVSFIAMVYAIVLTAITYPFFTTYDERTIGFLIGILGILSIKYIFPLIIENTDKFEKKNWLGHGFIIFFTWLAVSTLLLNPPFYDEIDPEVTDFTLYYVDGDAWESISLTDESPPRTNIDIRNNITLRFTAVDNWDIQNATIEIYDSSNQVIFKEESKPSLEDNNNWTVEFSDEIDWVAGVWHNIHIIVYDKGGNINEETLKLSVRPT